ncbi:hypothetical protein FB107DRAFT_273445 [Schizophyllum commune]
MVLHYVSIGLLGRPPLTGVEGTQWMEQDPSLQDLIAHAHDIRKYESVRSAARRAIMGRPASQIMDERADAQKLPSILSSFLREYVLAQRLPWLQWQFPDVSIDPYESSAFYDQEWIPALHNSPRVPCLQLHRLGSFMNDPVLKKRVNNYFRDRHSALCNASGSGKTRILYEGLCRHWGFYIVCRKKPADVGSIDLYSALQEATSEASGFCATLPADAHTRHLHLVSNQSLIRRAVFATLLARADVFAAFLEAIDSCCGQSVFELRDQTYYRKLWLLLQLDPEILVGAGLPSDIFHEYTMRNLDLDTLDLERAALLRMKEVFRSSQPFYIVLDEVQDAARQYRAAFDVRKSAHPLATKSAPRARPLLSEMISQLTDLIKTPQVYFVLSGTSLTADDVSVSLQEHSARLPSAIYVHRGRYQLEDIGGFDDASDVQAFTTVVLPPLFNRSFIGMMLHRRMFRWLRGRFRFIVSFIMHLMQVGLMYPHQVLDEYIECCTSYMPTDGVYHSLKARDEHFLESVSGIALAKLHEHPNARDKLFRDKVEPTSASINEPLVILALNKHFNSMPSGLYTAYHHFSSRIHIDGSKENGLENFLAMTLVQMVATEDGYPLNKMFRFARRKGGLQYPLEAADLRVKMIGIVREADGHLVVGPVVDDNAPRVREGLVSRRPTCNLGSEGSGFDDTLAWCQTTPTPIFFPDSLYGPDLAAIFLLSNSETVWLKLQSKYRASQSNPPFTAPLKDMKDALRSVTPSNYYKSDTKDPAIAANNARKNAKILKALDSLPWRTKTLAGKHSVLRAVVAFPCAAVIERATSEDPDKDDHPIAELNLDMAREATKHLPPTEVMAGAFLSRVLVPKNSSRYPLPPADDTVRYALAWQHRQMMEERSRRRNTALNAKKESAGDERKASARTSTYTYGPNLDWDLLPMADGDQPSVASGSQSSSDNQLPKTGQVRSAPESPKANKTYKRRRAGEAERD